MRSTDRPWTRRAFLRLAATSGLGGFLAACGASGNDPELHPSATPTATSTAMPGSTSSPARVSEATSPAEPPAAEPTPRPAGRQELMLMGGTEWETPLIAQHSGVLGPSVLVLGGVHGNEPGGWLAAEQIAEWRPLRGSLAVVPRANVLATHALERTLPELGDLNRLYPGSFTAELPMERMAAHIVEAVRTFEAELVLDLHESWGFYVERGENGGTAFIGQTITSPLGPDLRSIAPALAEAFNTRVEVERDKLIPRDRRSFFRDPFVMSLGDIIGYEGYDASRERRGGSSLSLGSYVDGVTPVLIEMGQQNQAVERRAELHQLLTQTTLEMRGML